MKKNNKKSVEVRPPAPPKRVKVFVCDKPFWCDIELAWNILGIETATRGMRKEEFSKLAERYRLQIELWTSQTGNIKEVLCKGGDILGTWLDD